MPEATTPTAGTPGTTPTNSSTSSTAKTTIAVGISYNTAEARKFAFDASAMAEVTAELVGVPAPTELTRLLAERIKQSATAAPAPAPTTPEDPANAEEPDPGDGSDGSGENPENVD